MVWPPVTEDRRKGSEMDGNYALICNWALSIIAAKLGEPAYVPLSTGQCFAYRGFAERQRQHRQSHRWKVVRYWGGIVAVAALGTLESCHRT